MAKKFNYEEFLKFIKKLEEEKNVFSEGDADHGIYTPFEEEDIYELIFSGEDVYISEEDEDD